MIGQVGFGDEGESAVLVLSLVDGTDDGRNGVCAVRIG